MTHIFMHRRAALALGGAFALAGLGGGAAFSAVTGERKFVLVILRGAMDGLAAAPPVGDAHYQALRPKLAIAPSQALPLSDGFGLHPRLTFLHESWRSGELAIVPAAASPYRDRSHFDGQDVLESGGERVFAIADGWLNRAIGALPPARRGEGVALAPTIPLVLRGPAKATSWAPSNAPPADDAVIARLMDLYAGDPLLAPALASAVETAGIVGEAGMADMAGGGGLRGRFGAEGAKRLAEAAAKLMTAPNGPNAAVIAFDGWDTHVNQGAADGQLAARFAALDGALASLKAGLGAHWRETVVAIATEFGRTAAENGAGGTDHGTGGVAFVLGGAVNGGKVFGDWPGLARGALFQNRDVAPANDLRGLFMGVLGPHWELDARTLGGVVFPGAAGVRRIEGIVRA